MFTGRMASVALLFMLFSVTAYGANPAEGSAGNCKAFRLERNPVDPACSEHAIDFLKSGQCIGKLTRAVGPLELCGGNKKCGIGCLGENEEVAFDPNGANGCAELLFAVACCNPPESIFCLPASSYKTVKCKPAQETPPAELSEPVPQEENAFVPEWFEDPNIGGNPPSGLKTNDPIAGPIVSPTPKNRCGKGCKTAIALATAATLYGVCEWRDIGPCREDNDQDDHKGCKFGKGPDGHCLPEPPECPPCHGGVDCPPGCPNPSDDEDLRASTQIAPIVNIERRAIGLRILIPIGRRSFISTISSSIKTNRER